MSEIREILASAQQSEGKGDLAQAVRLLNQAAEWYRARDLGSRAEQMLRHVARLEAKLGPVAQNDDGFGFGDGFASDVKGLEVATTRGPRLDDSASAWCSFCCRPTAEVGRLVAGPAGSFICASCLEVSAGLLGAQVTVPARRAEALSSPAAGVPLLPAQERALARLATRPRCALVVGPAQSGKSVLLRQLASEVLRLESEGPLSAEDVRRGQATLDEGRRVVLAVRGVAPAPALVLQGDDGEERIYDSDALRPLVGELAPLVDAVLVLDAPGPEALHALGRALLDAKQAQLTDAALGQLVQLAARAGVGELAALVARIPSGKYR